MIWHEPFGLVAVEAMASGIPVIASDVGGFQDTVRDGTTGFRFPMGDALLLEQKISFLLDHPDRVREMGQAGHKIAVEEYDWDKIVDKHYVPLLDSVVKQKVQL